MNKSKFNAQVHHRKSIRIPGCDYSKNALYFLTICCYEKECLFGEIIDQEMFLNDAGKVADKCWTAIPNHFQNAVLHAHIVMPNHVHGIIELSQAALSVENLRDLHPQYSRQHEFQKMIPGSIASIEKGYKIGVTKWFRSPERVDKYFQVQQVWQRNYYENIIYNKAAYDHITDYILNNPKRWKEDKFYK